MMKMRMLLVIGMFGAAMANEYTHIRCQNTLGGVCGDSSRPKEMNCCDYGYCQPWNSGYYQCIDKPSLCPNQETDVDYYGHDLTTIYGLQPAACCDACGNTPNCAAYTFVNENPDGKTACFLKSSAIGWVEKKGAVSARFERSPPPEQCQNQELNVDYDGNDLKSVANTTEGDCCKTCSTTPGCRFYTYVFNDKTCYLKHSNAGRKEKVGVTSARVWHPAAYPTCPEQIWDIDYYGHDILNVRDVTYTQCCDKCSTTAGCVALTFIDDSGDGKSTCYLKSSTTDSKYKKGAMSSEVKCGTKSMGACGSLTSGPLCCPDTDYCQPWNPDWYQCVPKPDKAKCPSIEVGVDYYGGDLKTIKDLLVSSCCDACNNEPECKFFTFVNYNPDGHSACYLKKTMGEKKPLAGAVSGVKAA